jgi:hypothetical protein
MGLTAFGSWIAVLAGLAVVLGGGWKMISAIYRVAQDLRDNKNATIANTQAINQLRNDNGGRLINLEFRVTQVERIVLGSRANR